MVGEPANQDKVGSNPPAGWAARDRALAAWTWQQLVNRTDVWGYYLPPRLREPGQTFGRTAPRVSLRGHVFLTEPVLCRHFAGRSVTDVVGLHSTAPDNTSRWGGLDIDRHEGGTADPGANLRAALAWYNGLKSLGFRPLLTDSNGKGGFHLLALFSCPAPTAHVHAFLHWLIRDHAQHGLTAPPETFPKQRAVAPPGQNGQYGNWLRLPGRHHTRDHWGRVWDGARWLDGGAAVDALLSLDGADPALVPAEAVAFGTAPPPVRQPRRGRVLHMRGGGGGGLVARIQAYLAKLPHRSAGQGRDDVAYQFACWLVRDLRLTDEAALAWLRQWDGGNHPPKGEARLAEIIASAHHYGTSAYGCGLGERHEKITVRLRRRFN